jgi:peptidoglycan-N-acetylglucosamine deacetylase
LRAAYYVQDDAASYSSLKEHVHQIDMLFPQWLHVDSPDGTLDDDERRQPAASIP